MRILHLDAGREMRGGQWQVAAADPRAGRRGRGIDPARPARHSAVRWRPARKAAGGAARAGARHRAGAAPRPGARPRRPQPHAGRAPAAPRSWSRAGWRSRSARAGNTRAPRRYLAVSEFVKRVLMEGGVPEEKISVVYDGVPVLAPAAGRRCWRPPRRPTRKRARRWRSKRRGWRACRLELARDLERDLGRARLLVYITHSEGPRLGRAAGHVGGRPGDRQQGGRPAGDHSPGRDGLLVNNEHGAHRGGHAACCAATRRSGPPPGRCRAADRDPRISRGATWFAVPWRFTGRCCV